MPADTTAQKQERIAVPENAPELVPSPKEFLHQVVDGRPPRERHQDHAPAVDGDPPLGDVQQFCKGED